jgi:hypothetical protein
VAENGVVVVAEVRFVVVEVDDPVVDVEDLEIVGGEPSDREQVLACRRLRGLECHSAVERSEPGLPVDGHGADLPRATYQPRVEFGRSMSLWFVWD